jgi:hypothetical protein
LKLSIKAFGTTIFGITVINITSAFCKMTLSSTRSTVRHKHSIATCNIMKLSIMTFSIMTFSY